MNNLLFHPDRQEIHTGMRR